MFTHVVRTGIGDTPQWIAGMFGAALGPIASVFPPDHDGMLAPSQAEVVHTLAALGAAFGPIAPVFPPDRDGMPAPGRAEVVQV